jgi:5-(carboxyamino)imidazole ribonucleotide synthase
MLNFIGSVPEASKVLSIADCHLHDYSKAPKAGRKVGHATLRSATAQRLQQQIVELEALL